MRQAGIICPIGILPSKFGNGDLGKETYQFIDIMCEEKIQIWYVDHLGVKGNTLSGDEKYINPDKLCEYGFLNPDDIDKIMLDNEKDVAKQILLKIAFKKFFECKDEYKKEYKKFLKQGTWLDKYVNQFEDKEYHLFLQFVFKKQYNDMKKYANDKNIKLMGSLNEGDTIDVQLRYKNYYDLILDFNQKIVILMDYIKKEIQLKEDDILLTSDYFSDMSLQALFNSQPENITHVASEVVCLNNRDSDFQNYIHYALNTTVDLVLINIFDYLEIKECEKIVDFNTLNKKRFKLRALVDKSKRRKEY
ncbi:MAG: 4-alpha-glucanotransferase [Mycoplasmatales bacterium]